MVHIERSKLSEARSSKYKPELGNWENRPRENPTCHRKQRFFGNTQSAASQCALHSATLGAQWWAEPSLFPPSVARGMLAHYR